MQYNNKKDLNRRIESTVFPRNLAVVRFYFKTPFGAVTIRGQLDFEGGVYRDRHAHVYTASVISLYSCMHVKCECAHGNCCRPLAMRRDFEGAFIGTSWQIDVATFRGQRDFEEIQYRDFSSLRLVPLLKISQI